MINSTNDIISENREQSSWPTDRQQRISKTKPPTTEDYAIDVFTFIYLTKPFHPSVNIREYPFKSI